MPSAQYPSQIILAVDSAQGTRAAVAGSGRRCWSAYRTSSLYRVPSTTEDAVSSVTAPPYMFSPLAANPSTWASGTIFERLVP